MKKKYKRDEGIIDALDLAGDNGGQPENRGHDMLNREGGAGWVTAGLARRGRRNAISLDEECEELAAIFESMMQVQAMPDEDEEMPDEEEEEEIYNAEEEEEIYNAEEEEEIYNAEEEEEISDAEEDEEISDAEEEEEMPDEDEDEEIYNAEEEEEISDADEEEVPQEKGKTKRTLDDVYDADDESVDDVFNDSGISEDPSQAVTGSGKKRKVELDKKPEADTEHGAEGGIQGVQEVAPIEGESGAASGGSRGGDSALGGSVTSGDVGSPGAFNMDAASIAELLSLSPAELLAGVGLSIDADC